MNDEPDTTRVVELAVAYVTARLAVEQPIFVETVADSGDVVTEMRTWGPAWEQRLHAVDAAWEALRAVCTQPPPPPPAPRVVDWGPPNPATRYG